MNRPEEHLVSDSGRTLHRLALATLIATFPLIFMGGLVTSKKAGMSVPDWPNSYGYNMFLFPPAQWVGGIFYEHTHRLLGTLVGFGAILMVAAGYGWARSAKIRRSLTWIALVSLLGAIGLTVALVMFPSMAGGKPALQSHAAHGISGLLSIALICGAVRFIRSREPRAWVRRLTVGVLLAVIFQGLLGGLRVEWVALPLAVVHGCFAQLTFCLMVLCCVATSQGWRAASLNVPREQKYGWTASLAVVTIVLLFGQLIAGALMRHYDAGLAIPDLPLAYGKMLPPTDEAALSEVNRHRAWDLLLPEVTLLQIWMHFAHRAGAVVVSVAIGWLVIRIVRRHRSIGALYRAAIALALLTVVQITLGVLTVLMKKPADIATLHVATGALTLATATLLAIHSLRLAWLTRRLPRQAESQKSPARPLAVAMES